MYLHTIDSISDEPHLEIVYLLQCQRVRHVQQLPHIFFSTPHVYLRVQKYRSSSGRAIQRERRLLNHDCRCLCRSLISCRAPTFSVVENKHSLPFVCVSALKCTLRIIKRPPSTGSISRVFSHFSFNFCQLRNNVLASPLSLARFHSLTFPPPRRSYSHYLLHTCIFLLHSHLSISLFPARSTAARRGVDRTKKYETDLTTDFNILRPIRYLSASAGTSSLHRNPSCPCIRSLGPRQLYHRYLSERNRMFLDSTEKRTMPGESFSRDAKLRTLGRTGMYVGIGTRASFQCWQNCRPWQKAHNNFIERTIFKITSAII